MSVGRLFQTPAEELVNPRREKCDQNFPTSVSVDFLRAEHRDPWVMGDRCGVTMTGGKVDQ